MQQTYLNGGVVNAGANESAVNAYVAKVFGWMFLGLLITCLSTVGIMVGVNSGGAFAEFIYRASGMVFIVFIVEVLIVGVISARVAKMRPSNAIALYVLYAIINGFTVGLFSVLYSASTSPDGTVSATLGTAFGITALVFGIMAVYGMVTKSDLTKVGSLLKMGLIGVLIMSVVNLFLNSPLLDHVVCIAGLFVFLGLVAYDTRKIKAYYAQIALSGNGGASGAMYATTGLSQQALGSNLAIVGALMLYLDFINIFLFVLRLLGGGSRR
jgi:FtsH-binding integral membrane protein